MNWKILGRLNFFHKDSYHKFCSLYNSHPQLKRQEKLEKEKEEKKKKRKQPTCHFR